MTSGSGAAVYDVSTTAFFLLGTMHRAPTCALINMFRGESRFVFIPWYILIVFYSFLLINWLPKGHLDDHVQSKSSSYFAVDGEVLTS